MKQTANYFALLSLDDAEEEEKVTILLHRTPNTPPPTGSPLTDKVPAELRLKIFELVLQSPHSVVSVGHLSGHKRGRKFNTALFRVSRIISEEAEEIFYKTNTIRAKSLNDHHWIRPKIRYLELADDIVQRWFFWPGSDAVNVALTQLLKLKTIVKLTDCVQEGPWPAAILKATSPDAVCPRSGNDSNGVGGGTLVAIEYGMQERLLGPGYTARFLVKHIYFTDVVAYARSFGPGVIFQHLRDRCLEHQTARPRAYVCAFFAFSVACLEALRTKRRRMRLDEADQRVLDESFRIPPVPQARFERLIEQIPSTTRLLDLRVKDHGSEIMALAERVVGAYLPSRPKEW